MDKLTLNIPGLQEAVAQTDKVLNRVEDVARAVAGVSNKLQSSDIWQGDAANAYEDKSARWSNIFKAQENSVSNMKDALTAVLVCSENMNRQALGFAGIVGGFVGGGARNILTYDPASKSRAIIACDRVIDRICLQIEHLSKIENTVAGVSGDVISSELSSYRKAIDGQKNNLCQLREAIEKYASSAAELVALAASKFASVGASESGDGDLSI